MSTQFWGTTSFAEQQARTAQLVFYGTLGLWVGPLTLGIAWGLRRWTPWWLYTLISPFSFQWFTWWGEWIAGAHLTPSALVWWWWGGLVAASPLIAVVLHGWEFMFNFLRPRDLQDHLEEQQRLLADKNAQLSRQAAEQSTQPAPAHAELLTLGVYVKGDRLPAHLGVQRTGPWVRLEERVLDQHLLIVGTTGAGKSETLKRLVIETLQACKRDIFFVDGKGDLQLGQEIAQLIYAARGEPVPLFSLGTGYQGAVYHGFRGDAMDVYNRLAAMVGVEEASGNARIFASRDRNLLQLVCYAPAGPPRSFEALRERLDVDWLRRAYRESPTEIKTIDALTAEQLESVAAYLLPLSRDFAPLMGEEGFVLEESAGAVFSLRTMSVGDTARSFLNFLVEDLKDFAGKRQRRPGLLIIDEFGAFQTEQIVALLMLARSAKLGVVLATQDVASLGKDEQARRLILANTRTKLLMASDFPEEVAQLAGTVYQIEASIQHEEGQATGVGSARVQHAFRVDMNEAAQLLPGETFLIRQRHAVKLRVKPVDPVAVTPEALAQIAKRPPAPPPVEPPAPPSVDLPDLDL